MLFQDLNKENLDILFENKGKEKQGCFSFFEIKIYFIDVRMYV